MEKTGQNGNFGSDYQNGVFSGQRGQYYGGNPKPMNSDIYRDKQGNYKRVRPYIPPRGNAAYPNKPCYPNQCAGCPYNKKNDNTALIVIAVASVVMLFIAFLVTLCCFMFVIFGVMGNQTKEKSGYSYPNVMPYTQETPVPTQPEGFDNAEVMPQQSEDYYGEVKDSLRTDLPYSIQWENFQYEGNSSTVSISVDYPVIYGEVPNRELLNEIIAKETKYFQEYYEEYAKYMMQNEVFAVYAEGCVTYMDEEKMSVVFCETVATDYWQDSGLYCINIDMENGVIISNSSIMDVDDAFAVDFRIRSREQNGSINALDYMTDQEISYYLSSEETAIIFYTPLGMEVGINYGESYVTVTYKDYETYLQKY